MNLEIYSENPCIQSENIGKYGLEKTLYLDTFHTLFTLFINNTISVETFSPISLPFTQILEKEHVNGESDK